MAGGGKRWSAGDFSIVRLMSNDREMTGGDMVAGRRSAAEGKGEHGIGGLEKLRLYGQ